MTNKLYVGGLSYTTTNESLEALFQKAGQVVSSQVIFDRETGRSRGFGFVEMNSTQEASDAVSSLNSVELDGRTISVNEARAREPRRSN